MLHFRDVQTVCCESVRASVGQALAKCELLAPARYITTYLLVTLNLDNQEAAHLEFSKISLIKKYH